MLDPFLQEVNAGLFTTAGCKRILQFLLVLNWHFHKCKQLECDHEIRDPNFKVTMKQNLSVYMTHVNNDFYVQLSMLSLREGGTVNHGELIAYSPLTVLS